MSELTLPRTLVNTLLMHAQQNPAQEVCGLIVTQPGGTPRYIPMENSAAEPAREFELEPAALVQAMRELRESHQELVAIFHSHPHAPADMSARDRAETAWPDIPRLIASLNTRGILELKCWLLSGDNAQPVELRID